MRLIPTASWSLTWRLLLMAVATRLATAAESNLAHAEPAARIPWTTSRIVGSPEPPLPYTTEPYLPGVAIQNPVFVAAEPGTSNLMVILQGSDDGRPARILRVDPNATLPMAIPFLEIPKHLTYSIAFHPGYPTNGLAFLIGNGPRGLETRTNRIWQIQVSRTAPFLPEPGAEKTLLEWASAGHDGGGMDFDRGGFLYISTGDGSNDSDALDSGQSLDDLLGAVLRIDVDRPDPGHAYGIPRDNPFVDRPGARGEIWAYGLRNPWRLCVDRPSGQVWVGNNGQDLWETAHLVRRGENYGWSVYEGSHLFYRHRRRGPTPVVAPTFEHPHSEARSLTGGVVYRGTRLPELDGVYVYGDHSTGRLWGGRHDGTRVVWHRELASTPLQPTAFAVSPKGDLLIADLGSGLHRLIPATRTNAPAAFPRKLSETGLFSSTRDHRVQPGVVAYSLVAPAWTDGAKVEHFLGLPGPTQATPTAERSWSLPSGTALVQTLSLPRPATTPETPVRIETRILVQQGGQWAGYSYRWSDDQSDAELVSAAGDDQDYRIADPSTAGGTITQRWRFPSRAECLVCHSRAAGFVLGISTLELDRDDQLKTWERLGLLTQPAPGPTAGVHLVDPHDTTAPLEARARSYLHANCAGCHIKSGGGNARMQLEITTARDQMELIGARPQHDSFGLKDPMLVSPGRPDSSVLLHRLSHRGPGQMPPLVSHRVDAAAVDLVRAWITSLAPNSTSTKGPRWTLAEFENDLSTPLSERTANAGWTVFRDRGCAQCHRLGTEGGSVGPDLTGIGQRRSPREILESILHPSKIIAPEYAQVELETKDGETWIGRIDSETPDRIVVWPMGADEPLSVSRSAVQSRRPHGVSTMPEGMLDGRPREEVLDLVALLAGGRL
ncbi:MAG: c-type cytochrome [Verrucomicrobia bacterium]|nr:c-type cytochrome [Verrucomicrobiota bacterium]